jgi:hypothetical protein
MLSWVLGAILLPLLLSEFTDLSPWMAKTLVRRAARRIPEQERPRWEDDWLAELASKPGRLWKLLWALWRLPLLRGPGEMGRLLGAPPVSEVVRARLRAAWRKLRFRPKAPAQEPIPEPVVVQAEVAQAVAVAGEARVVAVGTTRSSGSATLGNPPLDREFWAWSAGQYQELVARLAQQRQEFEADLDQKFKDYEARRHRLLRG